MRVSVYHAWEELQPLAADWNRVLAGSCSDTIFLTWEWCKAWWDAYGDGRSLFVLTAREGDELVGVGPFYSDVSCRWYGKWNCLRIIGDGSGDSDYLDCFSKPGFEPQVLASFLEVLESADDSWDWIQIESVPQDSPCLAALGEIAARRGWSFSSQDIPCATLKLPHEWEDYLQRLRPRVRTKIRSALTYFDRLEITPTECAATEELDSWLAQLFDLHTRRWQKRHGPGVFRSQSRQLFYSEVSRATLQRGWLAFHRLSWCERPLALQYGFRYHKHFYVLQEGYDPGFEKLRPGVALRGWVMRDEIEQGSAEYDFLVGTARHKLDWGARPKLSRLIRLAKKPKAIWISMSIPSVYKSVRENAGKLVPQTVRSWRTRLVLSHRKRRWEAASPSLPLTKQLVRWSASHLYSKTPLGALSRQLADQAWRRTGPLASSLTSSACTILRYHRVNDNRDPFFKALPVSQFKVQMQYLARHFQFLGLDQLAGARPPSGDDRPCVAVTFDDGYRDNFIHAFPVLREIRIPATIFLSTGYIDTGQLPWYDEVRLAFKLTSQPRYSLQSIGGPGASLETEEKRLQAMELALSWLRTIDDASRLLYLPELFRNLRVPGQLILPATMLGWNEIRQMNKAGIEFGAHTVTHPVLGTLSLSRLQEEILGSKTTLEDRLQVPVRHFAYPFGKPADLCGNAKQVVQAAGFQTAVTTIPGLNLPGQDLLELKRLSLEESDPGIFGMKLDWSRMSISKSAESTEKSCTTVNVAALQ